jgi:hypothetical protein
VERVAYGLLLGVAVLWLLAMLGGMIAAFPFGVIGLIVFLALGLLFLKVIRDRLASKEDDYYSNNVEK